MSEPAANSTATAPLPPRRARSPKAKQARANAIISTSEKLFLAHPDRLPTVAEIALKANIAKGTIYLYFSSKEELFLANFQRRLDQWTEALLVDLADEGASLTPQALVEAYLRYPLVQPLLMMLAVLSPLALEQNIDAEVLTRFKRAQVDRIEALGTLVASHVPGWSASQIARLFIQSYAALLGLWQLAEPPTSCRPILALPELQALNVSFADEVRDVLNVLWTQAWPSAPQP